MTTEMPQEMQYLKARLREIWSAGDFGVIARSIVTVGEEFVDRLDIKPGMKVLDVACGTGNLAIPAARTGADVTGIDIAANLIEQAFANAAAENLNVKFEVGDAEALPYADGEFDVVMTMFGAMFAPRPEVTASELKRVCKPGGRIAMANWTPSGFTGQMFTLGAKHVPPPPNMPPPVLWGDEETVKQRFGGNSGGISDLQMTLIPADMKFPFGPAEVVELFITYFGPTKTAYSMLDDEGKQSLRDDMVASWTEHNTATDGTTNAKSEYLEVIAVRS
jgi:ubiquinone/menaquinone biosynthesis C-methylase UbiE